VDGEIRVVILLRLDDRDVFDRVGILIDRVLADDVLFLDGVVVRLFLVETLTFGDRVEDGLRMMDVPTGRRVLTAPRERLEEVRDREFVVRLGVLRLELRTEMFGLELRLEVIDLDRLGEERRVDRLEVLLRLDVLDEMERLGLRVTALRDDEREAAALRLLLLELLLFRELLAAITGPTNKKSKQMMEKTRKIGFSFPFFCLLFSVF
jgi:hypothetical protein